MVGQDNGKKTVRQRMYDLLSDGYLHSAKELHGCLDDDLASVKGVAFHICLLREDLAREGRGVATHKEEGVLYYQLIRFVRRA